jgi:hypothetical protein
VGCRRAPGGFQTAPTIPLGASYRQCSTLANAVINENCVVPCEGLLYHWIGKVLVSSIKVGVKKNPFCSGRNFSCFVAYWTEQDLF